MIVDIITTNSNDIDAPPICTNRMNFGRELSRVWLIKHLAWSLNNGHAVHMKAVDNPVKTT